MNRAPKGAVLPNQKQPPDFSARLFLCLLIPRSPREQPYLIKRTKDALTLTPMAGGESELAFAGSMFRQGMEMMAHKG